LLSTADVCVNPDRVNPMNDLSTMNKIMEYMAFAKPIVQYDVTEGRFSAQKAALYAAKNDSVDFAACILRLIDNEDLRKEMGAFGRERVVKDLSWQTQIPVLLNAYLAVEGKKTEPLVFESSVEP
jgi:glycosyltransferase involved in cell wall biosynthesis